MQGGCTRPPFAVRSWWASTPTLQIRLRPHGRSAWRSSRVANPIQRGNHMNVRDRVVASTITLFISFCCSSVSFATAPSVEKSDFGTTRDNQKAELYTLTNSSGMSAKISTYGALLVELDVPDKAGKA